MSDNNVFSHIFTVNHPQGSLSGFGFGHCFKTGYICDYCPVSQVISCIHYLSNTWSLVEIEIEIVVSDMNSIRLARE